MYVFVCLYSFLSCWYEFFLEIGEITTFFGNPSKIMSNNDVFFYIKTTIYQNTNWWMECIFLSNWFVFRGHDLEHFINSIINKCKSWIYFFKTLFSYLCITFKNVASLWLLCVGMVCLIVNQISFLNGFLYMSKLK
jgi:hypothetical protein